MQKESAFKDALERIAQLDSMRPPEEKSHQSSKKAPISSPESGSELPSLYGLSGRKLGVMSSAKTGPAPAPSIGASIHSNSHSIAQSGVNLSSTSRNISMDDAMKQLEKMEESLSKSRRVSKNTSGSNYVTSGSNRPASNTAAGSISRQASAAPEQILLSMASTPPSKLNPSASISFKTPITDSIPEGSIEEKPGRLAEASKMMAKEQKNQEKNNEVRSEIVVDQKHEPEKDIKVKEEKYQDDISPKCMCVIT